MTPGRHLRSGARRLCSADTMSRLIEPVIADMQHEAAEACRAGRARRFWILAISYAAFWRVVLFHVPWAEGRRAWASAAARDRRAVGVAALVFVVVTLLLVAPSAQHLPGRNAREQAWMLVLLLPQAVALSIPMALFVAVVCTLRRRPVTARVHRVISLLAAATSLAMFFIINGLVPASNQAFRETLAFALEGRQYVLERGPAELPLLELRRQAQSLNKESRPRHAGQLLLMFHQRISLAAAPLALMLLALALAGARAGVAATIGVTACVAFFAWTFEASNMDRVMLGREWVAIALAWFPNVLLIATAMAVGVFSGDGSSEPRDA